MAWQTEVVKTSVDTSTAVTTAVNDRSAIRNSSLEDISNMEIVGLNCNKIPAMKAAIDNYIIGINQVLGEFDTKATEANTAFKSEEVNAALGKYLANVKEYSLNLASTLKVFETKLTDVQHTWQNYVSKAASNIDSTTNSSEVGKKYGSTSDTGRPTTTGAQ